MSERNDPEASIFPGGALGGYPGREAEWGTCGCWTCVTEHQASKPWPGAISMPFIVCPDCGNKRCPKAMHHDSECTDSNDVGQSGSRFA